MPARPRLGVFPQVLSRRSVHGLLLLCGTLLAASGSQASPGDPERRTLSGDRVAIHNLVGTLKIVPGQGASVVAEITPRGGDAARLRIEEGIIRGIPSLRVVYPSDRIRVRGFHGRSSFWVRKDGTLDGETGDGHRVLLSGREGIDAGADVRLFVPNGHGVDVYWGHGSGDVNGVRGKVSIDGSSLDVSAAEVQGSLHISVGSGTIRVTSGSGNVQVETGSGDVELRDVSAQALSIETGSGTIRASGLASSSVSFETGSGDIEAASIRASRANLETGSGNVGLLLEGDAQTVSVESGSGNVDVELPDGFGAAVHMETGSGSIETEIPVDVRTRARHELSGTMGDGRGRLRLETGSGNITVRRTARGGSH